MGEERKPHGIDIPENSYLLSHHCPMNPHPLQEQTVLSEGPRMLSGQKRSAVKFRLNPSYQRLEVEFNSVTQDSRELWWDRLKSQLHCFLSPPQASLTSSAPNTIPTPTPLPTYPSPATETLPHQVQLFGISPSTSKKTTTDVNDLPMNKIITCLDLGWEVGAVGVKARAEPKP